MDRYEDMKQVLTITSPGVLILNDRDIPLTSQEGQPTRCGAGCEHPDRFGSRRRFVPTTNMDAAALRIERAVDKRVERSQLLGL